MKKAIIIFTLVLIICAGIGFWYYKRILAAETKTNQNLPTQTQKEASEAGKISNTDISQSPKDEKSNNIQENSATSVVYPMDRFLDRITLNPFGNHLTGQSSGRNKVTAVVCYQGKGYAGYHTGNDLEVAPDELKADIPVKAIADGVVREVGHVTGYGGLIVIEHNLGGQIYTAYYGHINLESTSLKAGDKVQAGEKVAVLGDQCSAGKWFY